jgi:hypothetical protein
MKSRDAGFDHCFLVMAAPGVTKAVAVASKAMHRPTTAVTRQEERPILKIDQQSLFDGSFVLWDEKIAFFSDEPTEGRLLRRSLRLSS